MGDRVIRVVNNTSAIINVAISVSPGIDSVDVDPNFFPIPVGGIQAYRREGVRVALVVRANPVPVRVVPEVLTANPGVVGLIPDEGPFLVIN
ncbi:hypothetical protein L208DRAFT_1414351 [Tricholoma matsutake]|nr:hypothetical protein L208DRAFT_1414351 [Tricholoma matsutake 945]